MKIFKDAPTDWRDLQNKCAKLLSDIGFDTEVEKDIETVRGSVNVDVFAINRQIYPNEVILVECKYWDTRIPKTIIHAFRSVVADYGANSAYIISKVGFQDGAFKAMQNTNLCLMDFEEFQEYFRIRYLNFITTRLQKIGYPLRKYSDYLETIWDNKLSQLSEEKQKLHSQLCRKYDRPSLASLMANYKNIMTGELELEYIDSKINERTTWFPSGVAIDSYSEYFDWLIEFCELGVLEFDTLFGEKLRKE